MTRKPGRQPRSANQIEDTRAKIAAHALKLFQTEGYASVSIRRLAKEAGCAPMTIYAHFEGKIDILQHLWSDVLQTVFKQIRSDIKAGKTASERLIIASQSFVKYWLIHPEHFRLVFMSGDINRPDVSAFIQDDATLKHFDFFSDLVAAALTDDDGLKIKADALICSLIGIVFCKSTIADFPWTNEDPLIEVVIKSLIAK